MTTAAPRCIGRKAPSHTPVPCISGHAGITRPGAVLVRIIRTWSSIEAIFTLTVGDSSWIGDDVVRVIVRDNGHAGRPSKDRSGFGITGMAERVSALGGRFRAGPLKSGGWQILAEFPVAAVSA